MAFEFANRYAGKHLIVQPADARLNPPESYFYIQDGLIIACGVMYVLCYIFYMTRTYRDKTCAGSIEYLGATMAYEIFYAFAVTSTAFERLCFLMWILFDVAFTAVAIVTAYPPHRRALVTARLTGISVAGIVLLRYLCELFPDDREQVTAFWTGVILQLPISVGSVYLLFRHWDTKGHSLEIWLTRYLGCWTAYGLFAWRYVNHPENWSYVASAWSIWMIGITLLAETVYPFVYIRVHMTQDDRPKLHAA